MQNQNEPPRPFTEGRWDVLLNRLDVIPIGYLIDGVGCATAPGEQPFTLDGSNLVDPAGKVLGELMPLGSSWAIRSGFLDGMVGPILAKPSR